MEDIKTLYAYIDINNHMVAWETAIGRIASADLLEQQNIFTVSLRQFSIFKNSVIHKQTNQLEKELQIEAKRILNFSDKVSRLRGVYFFKSRDHAEAVVGRWNGKHFNSDFLSEVAFTQSNYSEYDSEWITHCFSSDRTDWIDNYLSGETYGTEPLTEILVSGLGVVLNKDLRQRTYNLLENAYPDSVPVLQLSCLGFDKGLDDIGQTVPFLLKTKNTIKGMHIINMRPFENGSKLFELIDNGEIAIPHPPKSWNGKICTPDFTRMGFECDISEIPTLISMEDSLSYHKEEALKNIKTIHS